MHFLCFAKQKRTQLDILQFDFAWQYLYKNNRCVQWKEKNYILISKINAIHLSSLCRPAGQPEFWSGSTIIEFNGRKVDKIIIKQLWSFQRS